ncbi:MAG: hypothetical protein LQ340_002608 [Diploschistes diacapsis]|nr:MAG: hypothetical protein LQ340_002608 [Diploschistes diacapsis]
MEDTGKERSENLELTPVTQYQVLGDFFDSALMASLDVDQRLLGQFARIIEPLEPVDDDIRNSLSHALFRILGLSLLLSKKLVRARRQRKLDNTRDTKSVQLYHHIIWLSREGLSLVESVVLKKADRYPYPELRVLGAKLRGSFVHIYVLFHNQPSISQATAVPSSKVFPAKSGNRTSIRTSPDPMDGGPVRNPLPPGLAPVSIPKPSASFLLPARDYTAYASQYFAQAAALADRLLTGSHPLRVSVKVEYAAYLYDCLHDGEASRKLAAQSLRDVYSDEAGMDNESFEETAKLVVILDKMKRRGAGASSTTPSAKGSTSTLSTPRALPMRADDIPPLPSAGRENRI